jgi:hypothetical protein
VTDPLLIPWVPYPWTHRFAHRRSLEWGFSNRLAELTRYVADRP